MSLIAHCMRRLSIPRVTDVHGPDPDRLSPGQAHEIGAEEGSIAGLVMILTGLFNVLAAALLAHCLH
jgi:hypothetical protein